LFRWWFFFIENMRFFRCWARMKETENKYPPLFGSRMWIINKLQLFHLCVMHCIENSIIILTFFVNVGAINHGNWSWAIIIVERFIKKENDQFWLRNLNKNIHTLLGRSAPSRNIWIGAKCYPKYFEIWTIYPIQNVNSYLSDG
jgi:hypothetical protein